VTSLCFVWITDIKKSNHTIRGR